MPRVASNVGVSYSAFVFTRLPAASAQEDESADGSKSNESSNDCSDNGFRSDMLAGILSSDHVVAEKYVLDNTVEY